MLCCDSLARFPALPPPVHLAVGVFDGVHLGHRAVIGGAVDAARAAGGAAAVLTFSPHPSRILRPQHPVPRIFGDAEKDALLAGLGVRCVVREPFTREFAALDAPTFLDLLRRGARGLAGVHVGRDFRFGHARAGDAALLAAQAERFGLRVFTTPEVVAGGARVSSTRIRALLEAGDVASANILLGRAYAAAGAVTGGRALGRTLGAPTLNLPWEPEARPRFGVYAVRARAADAGAWFAAVANYGLRPTVEAGAEGVRPLLETHLLADAASVAAAGFGEGAPLRVEWLNFLRPEKKFAGIAALRAQIGADAAAARAWFAARDFRVEP
jgi:riboflavin kinase/FMN adenylyltransferase